VVEVDEQKLIKNLIKGDTKAFEYFYLGYYKNLLFVANQYLHDLAEAEEIVQEVFCRVWHYRKNMDASLSFKAYIITIAKRLIYNKAKKKINQVTYEKYQQTHCRESSNILEEYLNFNELNQQINSKIQQLPDKRREIFIMSRIEGLSHKEIAEKLNISTNTVESQITKAIKFLKDSLIHLLVLFFL
jgi:RNA polymerase sigma-70 factor, ECF subfamily